MVWLDMCVEETMAQEIGRLFNYGHTDTTNIVERHWQFIKYTALRGRITQSITDLVHILIREVKPTLASKRLSWNGTHNDKKYVIVVGLCLVQIVGIKGQDL